MLQSYRQIRRLAAALAVLVSVAGIGLGWLSRPSVGGETGGASPIPRIESRQRQIEDREEGEVLINGQVALRIRAAAGGVTAYERAQVTARRLQEALNKGARYQDLGVRTINKQVVLVIGTFSLITVDKLHAALNGTTPERLAEIWMKQVRQALQASASSAPAPAATEPSPPETGGKTQPSAPEPAEPLEDRFVPILSVGEGIRVGVARISGPKAAVDTVKAVAQIEGEYKKVVRGRAFVPVATEDVIKDIERVHGVSVTGYADLQF